MATPDRLFPFPPVFSFSFLLSTWCSKVGGRAKNKSALEIWKSTKMKFESQSCIYTAISLSFLSCLSTSQNINVFLHLILHLKCFPHTEFFQFEKIQVFQILLDFPPHYREFLFPLQFSPIASPTILATLCNHILSLCHTADQFTIIARQWDI